MLAIGLEFLGGRYAATAYNNRDRAEWPPHPARLFSALVATWAETSTRDDAGRLSDGACPRALAWLAEQSPPRILASASSDVARRSVTTVFVPVNDVSVVSSPSREKLDLALGAFAAARDDKARAKTAKEVSKLEAKLAEATAKAVAKPEKAIRSDASAGIGVLPESRTRQPRTFPSLTPTSACVGFVWPDAQPSDETIEALGRLLASLVRVGHSSSFVAARILAEAEVMAMSSKLTTYREDPEAGEHVIRWVGPRQLRALEEAFELHRETEPRVLPAVFVTYGEGDQHVDAKPPASIFDPNFIVLARVGGPRLPIVAVPGVSRQVRRALMSALGTDVPELLSGHKPDGSPSERPHVAVVPLPVVGGPHADGALLGVALVLPREFDAVERRRMLAAVAKLGCPTEPEEAPVIHLHLRAAGTLELQPCEWGEDSRATLRALRWTRPSRTWVTATPIALDRNPGDLHAASQFARAAAFAAAEELVATAIDRIGLPRPREIEVLRSSVLGGTAKPRAHVRFPADRTKQQRVLVHARIEFDRKVLGPLLVGAGRYQGMGLFLPIDREYEGSR
jgi:CRISPR-associated protein Csb2